MSYLGTGVGGIDWEPVQDQVSAPLLNLTWNSVSSGVYSFPVQYTGSWASCFMYFNPTGNASDRFNIKASWSADQAGALVIATFTWHTLSGSPVYDWLVNLGPWLILTATDIDFAGTFLVHTTLTGLTSRPPARSVSTSLLWRWSSRRKP